ncbi:MAG: PepSY domain-containing protein [Gemmatimonadaceae bacterium]|nr:PepSY domain-containing protein [Gemmatimonadaceae bacterium]
MPNVRVLSRKLHRWGAVAVAIPFLVVIASGLLLQLKKQWGWVQPTEHRGSGAVPSVEFPRILEIARAVPQAGITGWGDIDRVDVRPGKGIMKITSNSRWEIQVDSESGAVLHSAYRRSDLLESLHDGSWFHEQAKVWIFFPSGVVVFALWLTGLYLWLLPYLTRRKRSTLAAGGGGASVAGRGAAGGGAAGGGAAAVGATRRSTS